MRAWIWSVSNVLTVGKGSTRVIGPDRVNVGSKFRLQKKIDWDVIILAMENSIWVLWISFRLSRRSSAFTWTLKRVAMSPLCRAKVCGFGHFQFFTVRSRSFINISVSWLYTIYPEVRAWNLNSRTIVNFLFSFFKYFSIEFTISLSHSWKVYKSGYNYP